MSTTRSDLLQPLTALRELSADESPYPGTLHAGDPQTVWVDLARVPEVVWSCPVDGHLLAPLDIARTEAGHVAIFPRCRDRLLPHAAAGVRPGTAVTIAVSLLRGAVDAHAVGVPGGVWWIDENGRPVIAAGDGDWRTEAADILATLEPGAGPALTQALRDARELLDRRRISADDLLPVEVALFAAAQPERLDSALANVPTGALAPRAAATLRRDAASTTSTHGSVLAAVVDAEWLDRAVGAARAAAAVPARAWARVAARVPHRQAPATPAQSAEKKPRRRAPWVVAAAVAALVVVGGVLWPDQDAGAPAVAQTPDVAGTPTSTAAAATAVPTDASADLLSVGAGILTALAACAGEESCAVMEDAGAAPEGVVSAGAADTTVSLLDEYGGVAVLRVEAPGASTQILVLVAGDGKWLVRDVYDVADQP